jgi:transposase
MTLCRSLSLDQTIALINDYADGAGLSQRKLCVKYKVSKGTVYNIFQQKDEYKQDFQSNVNKGIKRKLYKMRRVTTLMKLFSHGSWYNDRKIFHSRPLIQEKARAIKGL